MSTPTPPPSPQSPLRGPGAASRTLAGFIFASRWLQAPLYLGLIIAQAIYVVLFCVELWHLLENAVIERNFDEVDVMLSVLALIDIVMIANLLIMVIIGGYETFVSRIRVQGHHDEPEWLSHVNTNLLKIKLAVSIISISSIHLLKTFIEVGRMTDGKVFDARGNVLYSYDGVFWEVMIHLAFIVSALALAWIDRMSQHGPSQTRHDELTVADIESELRGEPPIDLPPATPSTTQSATPSEADSHAPSPKASEGGFVTVRIPAGAEIPEGAVVVEQKDH